MYWANATGCSQAWGAGMPSIPYTTNQKGKGPAWSNSLFEDNAEFALGMLLATKQQRARVRKSVLALKEALAAEKPGDAGVAVLAAADEWLTGFNDTTASAKAAEGLVAALQGGLPSFSKQMQKYAREILAASDQLAKKTVWMYGGDGWAYDIGFGGLDHVLAMGEDINVFVIDTEVYSNTGGQSSKATPLGAVAQFQSSGTKSPKKDLGRQMMPYGNIYIASVAMGADQNQLVKALMEADAYPGPSLVIAYTPCIAHGIKAGMDKIQDEMKWAVESGYWPLYRFDPRKEVPFQLDSKKPTKPYRDFIKGETRYASLEISFPENAQALFTQAEEEAKKRFAELEKLARM
jgi:pyruvate-ferredoxin/flavodoxin oxidoreductase